MTDKKELAITPMEISAQDLGAVMENEAQKRALITKYISVHMKSGVDYGTIKFGTKESKPSLFKPGSEKFLSLFKLTAQFEKDTDTWEMAGSKPGVFAYKCRLLTAKKQLVGEGRGVSNLSEKQGWTINNAVKIAEKRAQIDAVLRTGALSDFFTQDLEDMVQSNEYDQSPVADSAVPTVTYDDPENESPQKGTQRPWEKAKAMGRNTPKPPTELQKKKMIMDAVDSIVLSPLEKSKQAYEEYIFLQTGFDLEPNSYDAILAKLTKIKHGENE